jgi:hypothetical protein
VRNVAVCSTRRTTTRRSSPLACPVDRAHPTTQAEAFMATHAPPHRSRDAGRTHAIRIRASLSFGPKPSGLAEPVDGCPRPHEAAEKKPPPMPRAQRFTFPRRSTTHCSYASPRWIAEAGSRGLRTDTQQAESLHTRSTRSRCSSDAEASWEHESRLVPPRGRFEMSTPFPGRSRRRTIAGPFWHHHEWQSLEDRLRGPAAAMEREPHVRTRASKMRFPSPRRNVARGRLASTASKTPSRGSSPSSEIRCADRYVTACLTATFRSQGFSPSQRFGPRTSLRLYFTPLPLIGFRASRAFPASASRSASRHPMLSCH